MPKNTPKTQAVKFAYRSPELGRSGGQTNEHARGRCVEGYMRNVRGFVIVAGVVLGGCMTNDLNAPFQTKLTPLSAGQFRYVAASTIADPARGPEGERLRLQFLDRYFSAHNLCQQGYDIVYRTAFTQLNSRRWDDEESDGWVTYVIQCRLRKSAS